MALLEKSWGPLEADFQRYYTMNLARCCWGPDQVGVRRLLSLIMHLPPDSALARSSGKVWSNQDEAAAFAAEMLADASRSLRQLVDFKAKGKYRPKFPVKWPRPTDVPVEPMDRDGLRSLFMSRR